eukprot:g58646.t1
MVPPSSLVQLLIPLPCLCIFAAMFYKCRLDLKRHSNSRSWTVWLFVSRQLLIATCILICLLMLAMVAWFLLTDNVRLSVCRPFFQVLSCLSGLAFFFLYFFLYARLQTVGLFRSPVRSPDCGSCLLKCLNFFISGAVGLYLVVPLCFLIFSGSQLSQIGELPICTAFGRSWVRDIAFGFGVMFGVVLTGGFCFQVYRVSKSVSPKRDTQRWKNYNRALHRSLHTGIVTTFLLAFVLFEFARQASSAAPFVAVPIFFVIECSMTIYCLRLPGNSTPELRHSYQQAPRSPHAESKVTIRPRPVSGDLTVSSEEESSAASLREDFSEGVPRAWLTLNKSKKVSASIVTSEGSQQTSSGNQFSRSFVQPRSKYSGSVPDTLETRPDLAQERKGSAMSMEAGDAHNLEGNMLGIPSLTCRGEEGVRDVDWQRAQSLTIHSSIRNQVKDAMDPARQDSNGSLLAAWDMATRLSSPAASRSRSVLDDDDDEMPTAPSPLSIAWLSYPDTAGVDRPGTSKGPFPTSPPANTLVGNDHEKNTYPTDSDDENSRVRMLMWSVKNIRIEETSHSIYRPSPVCQSST